MKEDTSVQKHLRAPFPLDSKVLVQDLTERDAIPTEERFEGMAVYVVDEEAGFRLINGITNDDWGLYNIVTHVLTSNFDLSNEDVFIFDSDTAGQPITANLPPTPYDGQIIDLVSKGPENLTINGNGNNILDIAISGIGVPTVVLNEEIAGVRYLDSLAVWIMGRQGVGGGTTVHDYGILYMDTSDGDDLNNGAEATPVKTLQRAFDLRLLTPAKYITILVHGTATGLGDITSDFSTVSQFTVVKANPNWIGETDYTVPNLTIKDSFFIIFDRIEITTSLNVEQTASEFCYLTFIHIRTFCSFTNNGVNNFNRMRLFWIDSFWTPNNDLVPIDVNVFSINSTLEAQVNTITFTDLRPYKESHVLCQGSSGVMNVTIPVKIDNSLGQVNSLSLLAYDDGTINLNTSGSPEIAIHSVIKIGAAAVVSITPGTANLEFPDSKFLRFDPSGSSLVAEDVEAAIKEAALSGGGEFIPVDQTLTNFNPAAIVLNDQHEHNDYTLTGDETWDVIAFDRLKGGLFFKLITPGGFTITQGTDIDIDFNGLFGSVLEAATYSIFMQAAKDGALVAVPELAGGEIPVALLLSNFRIEAANPDRVLFDTNDIWTGTTFAGFTLADPTKTIIGRTNNGTSGSYFTVSVEYDTGDTAPTIAYNGADGWASSGGDLAAFGATPVSNNLFANTKSGLFDGIDSALFAAQTVDFEMGTGSADDPFTIVFWIKADNVGTTILSINDPTQTDRGILIGVKSPGGEIATQIATTNSNRISSDSQGSIDDLTWRHVVVTYDAGGLNTGILVYIDSSLQIMTPGGVGTYTFLNVSNAVLHIGKERRDSINSVYYEDFLDEMAIFKNIEFNQTQVNEAYNGGEVFDMNTHSQSSFMKGYHRFEDDLLDSSGNGHGLTLEGGFVFSSDKP